MRSNTKAPFLSISDITTLKYSRKARGRSRVERPEIHRAADRWKCNVKLRKLNSRIYNANSQVIIFAPNFADISTSVAFARALINGIFICGKLSHQLSVKEMTNRNVASREKELVVSINVEIVMQRISTNRVSRYLHSARINLARLSKARERRRLISREAPLACAIPRDRYTSAARNVGLR